MGTHRSRVRMSSAAQRKGEAIGSIRQKLLVIIYKNNSGSSNTEKPTARQMMYRKLSKHNRKGAV